MKKAAIDTSRPKTAADYAAIAVAPLLIFLMISSLANFLMLVLYRGGHPERVSWTLLMFTMGAVGIARVAIEKDRAYSLGYAGVLGIVAFLAMLKFVDSPIFSAFILVLIGYLADRIVHDCTLIDDSIDASGQGLIDSGRLFVAKQMQTESDQAQDDTPQVKPTRANKRNQPGRTVMYLAMAALPLFGLGQFFLRGDDATWRRALLLLAVYLFSALSLLVTTSFLGLRRYLRQRKVDMPADVSIAWLVGGLAMIAAILTIAYLAPMPGTALASFELPNVLDSPGDLTASRYGWGDDAAEKSDPDAASTRNDPQQDDKEVQSITPEQGAPPGDAGDGDRKDGPPGKQKGGNQPSKDSGGPQQGKSQDQSQSENQSQNQSSSGENSDQQNSTQNNAAKSDPASPSKQSSSEQSPSEQSPSEQSPSEQSPSEQSPSEQESTAQERSDRESDQREAQERSKNESSSQSNQSQSSGSEPPKNDPGSGSDSGMSDMVSRTIPMLSGVVRLIVFLALLAVVLWFLWLNRDAIAQWWRRLMERNAPSAAADSFDDFLRSETEVPPRSFASYRNPFGVEQDARRIVVITFQAFEAWTREHGSTRGRDETPSEFIRRVAQSLPQVYVPASQVVDAYNRIVYGRGSATDQDLTAAKQVWNSMSSA